MTTMVPRSLGGRRKVNPLDFFRPLRTALAAFSRRSQGVSHPLKRHFLNADLSAAQTPRSPVRLALLADVVPVFIDANKLCRPVYSIEVLYKNTVLSEWFG